MSNDDDNSEDSWMDADHGTQAPNDRKTSFLHTLAENMYQANAKEQLKHNAKENETMTKVAPANKEYLINGDNYFPNLIAKRSSQLPPGAYECAVTNDGTPYFKPISIITDEIVDLTDSAAVEIAKEVKQFWSKGVTEKFQQYKLVHKRGVMLAGSPGTGKTITLARCARMVIQELNGIVLFNPNPGVLKEYLRLIRTIETDKKVLVMWEEFDTIMRHDESELLSLLDGETQVDNVFYLATTNYISKIPARIKNRPSRFARIIEVGTPSRAIREEFLNAKLHLSDMDKKEGLLQYSDDFTIDQLKDLIISVCCFGQDIASAAKKVQEMNADGTGVDDYNEEQTRTIFKSDNKTKTRSPLQPIR